MRAIKVIEEIPSNKAGIEIFANAIVQGILSGEIEPLEVAVKVDAIDKIIKAVKSNVQYRDVILDNADMYDGKTFEFSGVKITKADSVKYDYSVDAVWRGLKADEDAVAEKRKAREKLLQTLSEVTQVNGVEAVPPVKSSTSHLRFTF